MDIASACLCGFKCRFNGKHSLNKKVFELYKEGKVYPLCPESLGELSIPRIPCELIDNRVINKDGEDKTYNYKLGARRTLEIAKLLGSNIAILKSCSPSCGFGLIYDGSFSGRKKRGNGVTADLLNKNGIQILTEDDL